MKAVEICRMRKARDLILFFNHNSSIYYEMNSLATQQTTHCVYINNIFYACSTSVQLFHPLCSFRPVQQHPINNHKTDHLEIIHTTLERKQSMFNWKETVHVLNTITISYFRKCVKMLHCHK